MVPSVHRLRRGLLRLRLERRVRRRPLPAHAEERGGAVELFGGPETAGGGAGALCDALGACDVEPFPGPAAHFGGVVRDEGPRVKEDVETSEA